MPFVPTADEAKRLRAGIERASFTEGERIAWLTSLAALLTLDAVLLFIGASVVGAVGAFGGFAVLYWRLRGGHLPGDDGRELHGLGLRTRAQRAFTALMCRHVLTGRNPMVVRVQHDPTARWQERVQASDAS